MKENQTKAKSLCTVMTFSNSFDANLAKSYLETENIIVFLNDIHMTTIYSDIAGGIKLQVCEDDYDYAVTLLQEGGFLKDQHDNNQLYENIYKFLSKVPLVKKWIK
jgi:hypothetical protein